MKDENQKMSELNKLKALAPYPIDQSFIAGYLAFAVQPDRVIDAKAIREQLMRMVQDRLISSHSVLELLAVMRYDLLGGKSKDNKKNLSALIEPFLNELALDNSYLERKYFQREIPISEMVAQSLGVECTICLLDIIASQLCLLGCGHMYHRECLNGYAKEKISNKIIPFTCPQEDCKTEIMHEEINIYLSKQLKEKYEDFAFHNYVESHMDDTSWCPTPGCSAVFTFDAALTNYKCPACQKHYCLACKCQFHTGIDCQEYKKYSNLNQDDRMFMILVKGAKFKLCPSCKFWVQKNEGCDHMTCRCKYEFCYVCGGKYQRCKCHGFVNEVEEPRLLQPFEPHGHQQGRVELPPISPARPLNRAPLARFRPVAQQLPGRRSSNERPQSRNILIEAPQPSNILIQGSSSDEQDHRGRLQRLRLDMQRRRFDIQEMQRRERYMQQMQLRNFQMQEMEKRRLEKQEIERRKIQRQLDQRISRRLVQEYERDNKTKEKKRVDQEKRRIDEKKRFEERKKLAEQMRRFQEEKRRFEEEKRRTEQMMRLEEIQKAQQEKKKRIEEKRRFAENKLLEEEKKRIGQMGSLDEEKQRVNEQMRRLEEIRKVEEKNRHFEQICLLTQKKRIEEETKHARQMELLEQMKKAEEQKKKADQWWRLQQSRRQEEEEKRALQMKLLLKMNRSEEQRLDYEMKHLEEKRRLEEEEEKRRICQQKKKIQDQMKLRQMQIKNAQYLRVNLQEQSQRIQLQLNLMASQKEDASKKLQQRVDKPKILIIEAEDENFDKNQKFEKKEWPRNTQIELMYLKIKSAKVQPHFAESQDLKLIKGIQRKESFSNNQNVKRNPFLPGYSKKPQSQKIFDTKEQLLKNQYKHQKKEGFHSFKSKEETTNKSKETSSNSIPDLS